MMLFSSFFSCKVPFWQILPHDKAGWILSSTERSETGNEALYGVANVIDGDFTTYYYSSFQLHPWIQIELQSSQLVKAVLMAGTVVMVIRNTSSC